MKQRTHNRSGIFLMEIIIAILIFSMVSAICLRCFVESHRLSEDTAALNHSVNLSSGAAETLSSADSAEDALLLMKEQYPEAVSEGELLTLYFDKDWASCEEAAGSYRITLTGTSGTGGLTSWNIVTDHISGKTGTALSSSGQDTIYELDVEVYYEE